jgi:hypothetical protein
MLLTFELRKAFDWIQPTARVCVDVLCCVVVDVLLQGCFGCVEDCVGMFFDGKRVLLLSLVRQTLSWNTSFFV